MVIKKKTEIIFDVTIVSVKVRCKRVHLNGLLRPNGIQEHTIHAHGTGNVYWQCTRVSGSFTRKERLMDTWTVRDPNVSSPEPRPTHRDKSFFKRDRRHNVEQ